MSEDWWDTAEVEDEPSKLPAKKVPKEMSKVDRYRMPDKPDASWIEAQLTKAEWREIKRTQQGTRLNPHLIESMCRDAEKGLSKRSIMARAGYSYQTWRLWEQKAAKGLQPYALWYQCIMISISSVEEDLIQDIRLAGQADWKASKWLLEQLNKEEFSPASQSGTTVNVAGDLNATNNTDNSNSVNYMDDQKAIEVARLLQQFGVVPTAIENVVEGEVVEDDPSGLDKSV
jgi:hypothetical protein